MELDDLLEFAVLGVIIYFAWKSFMGLSVQKPPAVNAPQTMNPHAGTDQPTGDSAYDSYEESH